MAHNDRGTILRDVGLLLREGSPAGLPDGALLGRFAAGGDGAEAAFSALIARHGPMVLRTCRAVSRDEADAQDAFQATFLALVRRAGGLRVEETVGPWLHRVAVRASARSRRDASRRREIERRAAEGAGRKPSPGDAEGIGARLEAEVDRLPARFRAAVVLCDLEGRSYEEAARDLGCPVGTVKSRLARGRERLRRRLGPDAVDPAAAPRVAVPSGLAAAALRGSLRPSIGAAPRPLLVPRAPLAAILTLGVVLVPGALDPRPDAAAPPRQEAGAQPPARSWELRDRYEPPDFERFFPDDPEGGRALDALFRAGDRDQRPDAEILRTVRAGLRRTTEHRTLILRWLGNRYVWGKPKQDPDAVEILYHAADFRGERADPYGTRHYAVYFGLSVVRPKPPAVLRTLADLCVRVDDPNDLDRVAWGAADQKDELLPYLDRHLASEDEATRRKAEVVAQILRGEVKAFEWASARSKARAQALYGARLPDLERTLREGDSAARKGALRLIASEGIAAIMDDSALDAFAATAGDADASVRRAVARVVGGRWIWTGRTADPRAVAIALRLSNDPDREVRHDAVYFGLSVVREKSDEVLRRLLEMALADREPNLYGRIAWGLDGRREAAAAILDDWIRGEDERRARDAREVYRDMTGREPPPGS